MKFLVAVAVGLAISSALSAESLITKLPAPVVSPDSWVMVEIWPDVKDITLSAYFLDASAEKNRNLCLATKRVFDGDQALRAKQLGKTLSSYRLCMSVTDAMAKGYVAKE